MHLDYLKRLKLRARVRDGMPAGGRLLATAYLLKKGREKESRLVNWFIGPGTTAIDVGANVGGYSYLLARAVGRAGLVVAIEPIAECADIIERGAKQLRLPVEVKRYACSSVHGHSDLFIPQQANRLETVLASLNESKPDVSKEVREVSLRTLDWTISQLEQERQVISFVKIDTEGHEFEVLSGASRLLEEHRPNLLIEIEQRHNKRPISDTFQMLDTAGYDCIYVGSDGLLHSLAPTSVAPIHVNNFFFIHRQNGEMR